MKGPRCRLQAVGETLWPDPVSVLAKVGIKFDVDVIDLCSGDGWFTPQIAKLARHVTAMDIDPALELGRRRSKQRTQYLALGVSVVPHRFQSQGEIANGLNEAKNRLPRLHASTGSCLDGL